MLKMFAIGYLGKDAEVKDVNGKKVIDFSIAHTEKYMQNNVQQEKTTWVRCSYWIEKTTIAQYLKKGTQVFVEGNPSTNAYTNKEGQNVADLRITINRIELLGSKNSNSTNTENPTITNENNISYNNDIKDDLPF